MRSSTQTFPAVFYPRRFAPFPSCRTSVRFLSDTVPDHIGHPSGATAKLSDISPDSCPISIGTLSALNRIAVRLQSDWVSDLLRNTHRALGGTADLAQRAPLFALGKWVKSFASCNDIRFFGRMRLERETQRTRLTASGFSNLDASVGAESGQSRVIAKNNFRMAEVNEGSDEAAGRSTYPQRYVQGRQRSLNPQAPCGEPKMFGLKLLEGSQGHGVVARLAQPGAGMRGGSRLALARSPSTIPESIFGNRSSALQWRQTPAPADTNLPTTT